MKKHLPLLTLALMLCATLSAAVPFKVTTITDGTFAPGTQWYTMHLGEGKSVLSDNGTADFIAISGSTTSLEAQDLWCFVGNDTDGYRLYNKQAGPTKVLATSTTMGNLAGYGGTGGSTYPVMKDATAIPEGWSDLWDFSASDKIANTEGYFLKIHGTNNAVNNFGGLGKLAFWVEGQDKNSTLVIEFAETLVEVKEGNGTWTSSNSNKTWHAKWSSTVLEGFALSANANNMQYSNGYVAGYSGASGTCTYTLTAPDGCIIAGYSFDFANTTGDDSYQLNFTVNGKTLKSTGAKQHVEVSDLEERTADFSQSGANKGVTFTDFTVTIRRSLIKPEPFFVVFETPTTSAIPYRIPAIARAYNGDLIAVADYRHSRADIGMAHNGRIDLRARISKDNGQTWGDIFDIVRGQGGSSPDFMNVGFGDPCIVADRESGKVLVLSCAGNVSFPNGTRNNHQNIARFYSEDNGATWGKPDDIAESIYSQFDSRADGPVRAMFIGSGKIIQSETVKAGTHYRLYCAALVKINDGTYTNFVFYSDDFGGTWKVLGGVDVAPVPSGADEPKVEELPDGSILISSRVSGGRWFNIYNFTNSETAEGYWNTVKQSNSGNNGVVAVSNSTNGELLLVPATRKEDGKPLYLLLQSVPFGSGRANVGIYYKELETLNDFISTDSIAANWDGRHQSSYLYSAYSTMCLQADNTIGFLYEEETYCGTGGGGYSIIYKNYSVEQITDSLYTYNADVDRNAIVAAAIEGKISAVLNNVGPYVGNYMESAGEALTAALDNYATAPSKQGYEAINAAIANAPRVEVEAGKWYTIRNHGRSNGTLYMTPEDSRFTVATGDAADADQLFSFTATDTEGVYNLYNGNYGLYFGKLGANETQPAVHETPEDAGRYTVITSASGLSGIACQNKTGGHAGIHLAGDCKRLVPWTTNAEASLWYIQPVEDFNVTIPDAGYATMCLPFAVSLPDGAEAYAVTGRVEVDETECLRIKQLEGAVPANLPVVVKATAGNHVFAIVANEDATEVIENSDELKGVLKAKTLTNSQKKIYTLSGNKFVKSNKSSVSVLANTAYLEAESEARNLTFTTLEGVPVGIESVTTESANTGLYDLNGKRVKNPTTGIYVTGNGQKVFIAR